MRLTYEQYNESSFKIRVLERETIENEEEAIFKQMADVIFQKDRKTEIYGYKKQARAHRADKNWCPAGYSILKSQEKVSKTVRKS